jgi:hypothetical protein
MKLQLKTDPESGAPIVQEDGKIVYVDAEDNNKELPLDPVGMYSKITDLNRENQKHRTKLEEVLETYSPIKDIEDLAAWKSEADKALETIANLNDKDWMKAEKVEKLKSEITAAYEDKLKQKDISFTEKEKAHGEEVHRLNNTIRRLLVSNQFAASKYFGGSDAITILPADIAEDHFGKYFRVEDTSGEPVVRAYYANGDPVLSKVNPGEPAEFEEAIGLIIDNYPGKVGLMRGAEGGSGSGGGGGDLQGGAGELANLRKQHAKALKDGNVQLAVTIKNRLFAMEQKLRKVS